MTAKEEKKKGGNIPGTQVAARKKIVYVCVNMYILSP